MKPQLYLHIGQPKSATTSIQSFLLSNRDLLIRQGYLYPKSGLQGEAHHPLGNFFTTTPLDWVATLDPATVKTALRQEVETSGCHKVIMSTEALFYGNVQPDRVKTYFDLFDVKILLTLRRQSQWIESALRDDIKTGHVTGEDVIGYVTSRAHAIDYTAQLARWAAVFGKENVLLTTFEPSRDIEPVEMRFLQSVGAKFSQDMQIAAPLNDRLSRDCLEFLRMMSQARRISAQYFKYFNILAAYSKLHPDAAEHRYIIPPDLREKIMQDHAKPNVEIARRYLGRDSLFHEDHAAETEVWSLYPGLSVKAAVLIGEFLANRLSA